MASDATSGTLQKAARIGRNFFPVVVGRQFRRPPILIGGCARSGTTLFLSILSCHPGIFAIPIETKCFSPRGDGRGNPILDAPFRVGRFHRILLSQAIPRSAHRWCEKTTKNVLTFGRILDHFEGRVRLIHLVRDGRDVVTSRHPHDASRFWVPPWRWVRDVGAGREWESNDAVLTLRYEDLVTGLETQLARLGEFLEEDFSGLSDSWHERATLRSSKNWFHRDLLLPHSQSIGRWRDPAHRKVVEELMAIPDAARLLDHFGYETSPVPSAPSDRTI